MWTADRWNDYEVLDTSGGEKLERWGDWLLVRPDPQVIWQCKKQHEGWQKPNAHYHRSKSGGGSWDFFDLPKSWTISYVLKNTSAADNQEASVIADIRSQAISYTGSSVDRPASSRLNFHLKPFAFKHTGLFPEQAVNWDWFYTLIRNAGRPVKVLNLFAYTGGATCAALAAGASVTHVDASKGMVTWARENTELSGLADRPVRWLVDDCSKFVQRELRRGNQYDAVIMDPPSYGRGPKGEVWKLEDTIWPLLGDCAKLLSSRPLFFLLNSYTTGLQSGVLSYMLRSVLTEERPDLVSSAVIEADEIGLPVTSTGQPLPCGCSARITWGDR